MLSEVLELEEPFIIYWQSLFYSSNGSSPSISGTFISRLGSWRSNMDFWPWALSPVPAIILATVDDLTLETYSE